MSFLNVYSGILSPGSQTRVQQLLQGALSPIMFEKLENILRDALVPSMETSVAVLIVYVQCIIFHSTDLPDVNFVRNLVESHGVLLVKHCTDIFNLRKEKEKFANFLLLIKDIEIPKTTCDTESDHTASSCLLDILFLETEEENISEETVYAILMDIFSLMQNLEHGPSLKALCKPYVSRLMHWVSIAGNNLQKISVHLLAILLTLSPEELEIIQMAYKLEQSITSPDSVPRSINELKFFSEKQTKLLESAIGPDMTPSDWVNIHLEQPLANISHILPPPEAERAILVGTPTTIANIHRIAAAAIMKTPLLLQGPAGVGKTATISEAAHQSGNTKQLIRFNLSTQTAIEDLIGKVMLVPENGSIEKLKFIPYSFTIAFRDGHWLLLDELNLAPDNVLQALESALDTGTLILPDIAVGEDFPSRVIPMHSNFRVFATQNPNSGYFKNAREKLSPSFLDRFSPVNFQELPETEWCQIIQHKIKERGIHEVNLASQLATIIVRDHQSLTKMFRDQNNFTELASFSDTSIRDLLKLVDHLAVHYNSQPNLFSQSASVNMLIGFELWSIYGARFRAAGRREVRDYLALSNYPTSFSAVDWDIAPNKIVFDGIVRDCKSQLLVLPPNDLPAELIDKMLQMDRDAMSLIYSKEFILKHGVYIHARTWINLWCQMYHGNSSINIFEEGCCFYYRKFVHDEARQSILKVFQRYDVNPTLTSLNSQSLVPDRSFAVTQNSLLIWKQLALCALGQDPIRPESFLVVGRDGCGKSDCIRAFAALVGRSLEELCVMPETEPSAFIGQFLPNDKQSSQNESKIIWKNGAVTDAFQSGSWLLIDNFSLAAASTLERLNPILEQPPELTLTERGDSSPVKIHPGYCLFATMTPPIAGGGEGQGHELSPALNNRFTLMFMDNICKIEDKLLFMKDAMIICRNNLPEKWSVGSTPTSSEVLCDICWTTLEMGVLSAFTVRSLVRIIDFAYSLSLQFPESSVSCWIWTSFSINVVAQIQPSRKAELICRVSKALLSFDPQWSSILLCCNEFQFENGVNPIEYVLTTSRNEYAQIIDACVNSRTSILLEGGAATGKTTLILALAKWKDIKVERVNNTDGTTVQDYLGCYLPDGKSVVFKKGPLYRAMQKGYWFLADEFNLADPSVMSLLIPILEGRKSFAVPGTDKEILIHSNFHFFATQNGSGYRSRKK